MPSRHSARSTLRERTRPESDLRAAEECIRLLPAAVGQHDPMTARGPDAREAFTSKVQALEGLRIQAVDYWDIHNFGPEPARWDYGDWHQAVMGAQLSTDAGPVTVTWTNTFHPYGVEVFADPIERHLVLGEADPERIGPDVPSRWAPFLDSPIRKATTWWDQIGLGPSTLQSGEVVALARVVDVPTAIRLDFEAGHIWFLTHRAIPQPPAMEGVFIPGDEIMVVFPSEKLRDMGFEDPSFVP